jgi:hypothetical protein
MEYQVSGGGEWGCGSDGCFLVMLVDGVVSGSRFILDMYNMGFSSRIERMYGSMVDEMGWGFRTILGEIPILNFL